MLIQRTHGVVVAAAESFHHGRIETCIWHLMIVADADVVDRRNSGRSW